MKTRIGFVLKLSLVLTVFGADATMAQQASKKLSATPQMSQGPCDIYAAAGAPCVAAHSTTRALYASYRGPLYQVLRQSDGKTLDIVLVQPVATPSADPGGYANAAAQDAFCANTYCWITTIYDQSGNHNDLTQAPRGGFSGPAMGGFNNLPLADMAPITVMGHKVYGVFIAPGEGLRINPATGTAVDDQAEGQYWVISGVHYNSGCCFDYGNAEIDSRDDGNGTMETTYFGNSNGWYHGRPPGPWVMTDQENNLVGCANADGSKFCPNLPSISWRFVTAMAKGEPHHWTSMGGDAQRGNLSAMFDGPRVNATYDPMRKQGAILLGNGGDNSNSSQGTFYEGAITKGGTFPTHDTDQQVQANVVSAKYATQRVSVAPASATATPPGLQTFSPGSSQETTVTFTNTGDSPATDVSLSVTLPRQWTAAVDGTNETSKTIAGPVAPGKSVTATFKITSGARAYNGDLMAKASWTDQTTGRKEAETIAQKVRNVSPVKINELRIGTSSPANPTNSFIELYNAGSSEADISNWTLTEHPAQQAIFSTVKVPAETKLAAHGFYLLGLSNSGLAAAARAGDRSLYVRSTTGMSPGDTISIDTASSVESRKIVNIGSAASTSTTVWQPVPDGPVITIPAGSTIVPVTSVAGFQVGEKIALGYGAKYPAVANATERYEVATVTAVGKPGTQAFLGTDAPKGSKNIKVTSVANISVGDKITLDIASMGHGVETVTVAKVGTAANRTVAMDASAGTTTIKVRNGNGLAAGDKLIVGTPASREMVSITAIGPVGSFSAGTGVTVSPALTRPHISGEEVVSSGSGLDLAAPLKFGHATNLPFSDRGTGITFQPASSVPHSSNEPIQALGTGITLDTPLAKDHAIDAVVRDAAVTTAGYQGGPAQNQWFGGPALYSTSVNFAGVSVANQAGSMVLRDAAGLVVDTLNYGLLVDPWAAEGYQATSGAGQGGCRVAAPSSASGAGTSSGRFPDGADMDSNCTDFLSEPATTLSAQSVAGSANIKVASVAGFSAGQPITVDTGANNETATIATVGSAGGTTVEAATTAGATAIPVANVIGFSTGQTITVGAGADQETAEVASINRFGSTITVSAPLRFAHTAGAQVSGTGVTLTSPLAKAHAAAAQIAGSPSTPGAPNRYYRQAH